MQVMQIVKVSFKKIGSNDTAYYCCRCRNEIANVTLEIDITE